MANQDPDPKAFAQRRFATPDTGVGLIELAERYATDAAEALRTLLEAVSAEPAEGQRICELGFGTGWLLEEMAREFADCRLYGLDMSAGMAQRVQGLCGDRVAILLGDMEQLPFRQGSLDAVVRCWTLYFMRDIDAALEEIGRCLRPGGRLVAAANAPDHMAEYGQLAAAALDSALGRPPEPDIGERFDLGTGEAYMRRHFQDVEVCHCRGWMTLPHVEHLLRFWDAWRPGSLGGPEGDLVRAEFERLAQDRLRRDGQIRISRHGGAFVGKRLPQGR